LKADGSVDSSTYLTTASAASTYLPLIGGTLTGALIGTTASFSGKVAVNATIAAWMSAFSVIQMGALTSIWNSDIDHSAIGHNVYYTGTFYKYLTNTFANKFEMGDGVFTWDGAASGTAGNNVIFTEYMRLNASGNLGINTTTIGSKIQVNGNAAIGYSASTAAPTNGLVVNGNTLIGTTTDANYKLDVNGTARINGSALFNGNSEINVNQNSLTRLLIRNTTAGTGAYIETSYQVDSSGGAAAVGKYSSATSTYKIITGSNSYLFNSGAGDIAILNDFSSGTIKMAAGGSTTAHLTIATSGAATFTSTVISAGFEVGNGQFYRARRTSSNLLTDMIGIPSGTDNVRVLTTGAFNVVNGSLATMLGIADNGAATFISTIKSTSLTTGTNSGSSVNITTNSQSGDSGSPLATELTFKGFNGNNNGRILVNDVSNSAQVGNMAFFTYNGGQVSCMTLTQQGNAYFNSLGTGTVYSNGGVLTNTNPSDERLKENIKNINWGLNEILQLKPVEYTWKDDKISQGKQYGFIAQDVQKIMPDLVKEFIIVCKLKEKNSFNQVSEFWIE
jgi:hypothetical protein